MARRKMTDATRVELGYQPTGRRIKHRRRPSWHDSRSHTGGPMSALSALPEPLAFNRSHSDLVLARNVVDRFLTRAEAIHDSGLKSYGLFVADPGSAGFPFTACDAVFFDPEKNRRNDPRLRSAFEAQGSYFRSYDDAGFVADSRELLLVHQQLERRGLEAVAMFHSHRRQPANFSHIDYRLHNPAYPWHLILSMREPRRPVLRAFEVRKDSDDFGIDPSDDNQNSERDYTGAEVRPLRIIVEPRAA
jgi:proteasome lid subunit RPN8/RPN11